MKLVIEKRENLLRRERNTETQQISDGFQGVTAVWREHTKFCSFPSTAISWPALFLSLSPLSSPFFPLGNTISENREANERERETESGRDSARNRGEQKGERKVTGEQPSAFLFSFLFPIL
jgi:hypothetical protein